MTYQIGSENWWRLRRLQLSKVGDFLRNWTEEITIRHNVTAKELEPVYRFVHDRYIFAQIIEPQPDNMWITKFHLLPQTKVFTAYKKDDINYETPICTTTVVFDTEEFKLPSDNIYPDALDKLRKEGRKLVEFCSLAALPNLEARSAYFPIFKLLYKYVREQGFTDVIITIQPKHVGFYRKVLLFNCFDARPYPRFKGVKAQMAHLNLDVAQEAYKKVYGNFPGHFNLYDFFTSELEFKFNFRKIYKEIIPDEDFHQLFVEGRMWKTLTQEEKDFILKQREAQKIEFKFNLRTLEEKFKTNILPKRHLKHLINKTNLTKIAYKSPRL